MPRNTQLQDKRNNKIKQDFSSYKKENKYTTDYILGKLSDKYFLTERTIQAIVFGEYDRNKLAAA